MTRRAVETVDGVVGGPARRRVICAFAAVLALSSADMAAIGANATQLRAGLHIDDTGIGLLLTVSSLVGALASIPAGALVDRVDRTRLLAGALVLWGVAMALSGLSTDYLFLLFTRLALGIVVAVAGPAVASMLGDYFPSSQRGRVYGWVLTGELIGAGFGFVIAGQFAILSWRAPFFVLVIPTAFVWWLVHRLPEPARGGASRLPEGAREIRTRDDADRDDAPPDDAPPDGDMPDGDMPLRQAVRLILRVRTNVVLIVASALGYFFFSGLRGFAVEFAKKHYGVSQGLATSLTLVLGIGALVGVLAGGRIADRLLRRGRTAARVEVAGVNTLLAGLLFVPALVITTWWLALPLLILAAACLGAVNPPLDAARLDIMRPRLWGRAESVRTVLRSGADAMAPLLFGVLSSSVFAGSSGLEYAFLVTLSALFVAATIVLVWGRRTYPRDVEATRSTTGAARPATR